jgi:alpha,alpha-trehalase
MKHWLMNRRQTAAALLAALLTTTIYARDLAPPALPYPDPPQVVFQELFVAVQAAGVFPDGKEFADAIAKSGSAGILAEYRAQQPKTAAALKQFVEAHFSMPPPALSAPGSPDKVSITAHIDQLWDVLTRSTPSVPPNSSLLSLPRPYVVPGGRFREMYYWDSYFTLLGVMQSKRPDLARDMVDDFAYLIDTYGHIPNGVRTYYLSRSQPPFFYEMVGLLSADDPAASYARYLPQLRREYAFWMDGAEGLKRGTAKRRVVALPDGSVLNRFWDDRDTPRDESYREDTELARATGREPRQLYRDIRAAAESGWDFGSRWFADGRERATVVTTEILPVDLNSLLFGLERAIADGCRHGGDKVCTGEFERKASRRHAAMDRYLWDPRAGVFYDYRWTQHERIARLSAATLYPLFVGLASQAQANAVAATARHELLKSGGVVTTPLETGQQWDSPNGWAPLQWIAVDGLRHYGQTGLAAAIACRWMSGVNRLYLDSGKLVEKYDVVNTGRRGGGGEYPTQDGFGWTNGVMRRLMALYPGQADQTTPEVCPDAGASPAAPSVK